MGLSHFVYVDNGSADGTKEWLARQPDVNLYEVTTSYRPARHVAWIRRVTDEYGYNRWYHIADSDEILAYPQCETLSICEFVRLIGGGTPENLLDYVSTLQEELVRADVLPADYDFEAHREFVGMQPGDVPVTYADASALERDYSFTPSIGIREGLSAFAEWYVKYYIFAR